MAIPLFDLSSPLKGADIIAYKAALDNLQGNLLKSHGRDVVTHLFITFTGSTDSARQFLAAMSLHATPANEQQRQTERHKADPANNEMFSQVLLSARGYAYIGMDTSDF